MSVAEKEKEVEISRLKHTIMESELKKLKKLEEIVKIDESIDKLKKTLSSKEK